MNVSIVIPALNEQDTIEQLAKSIIGAMRQPGITFEIIFIDDGSSDSTFDAMRRMHDAHPGFIRVFRFARNFGKAAALSVGFEKAHGDIIVTMDADLQDDPAAIPDLIAKINEGWDLVSGWKKVRKDPIEKRVPSKLFNFVVSAMSGVSLHDFNCGFKAYRSQTAKSIEVYGERHRFLPALAHWDRWRVTEMPVPHHPRKFGRSKYGIGRYTNGLFDLLTLLFLRKYLGNPLHFFGLLGLFCGLIGMIILGYFGAQWIMTREMHIRPLTLLSVGAIIMGIQFIGIGLIGELVTSHAPRREYTLREALE